MCVDYATLAGFLTAACTLLLAIGTFYTILQNKKQLETIKEQYENDNKSKVSWRVVKKPVYTKGKKSGKISATIRCNTYLLEVMNIGKKATVIRYNASMPSFPDSLTEIQELVKKRVGQPTGIDLKIKYITSRLIRDLNHHGERGLILPAGDSKFFSIIPMWDDIDNGIMIDNIIKYTKKDLQNVRDAIFSEPICIKGTCSDGVAFSENFTIGNFMGFTLGLRDKDIAGELSVIAYEVQGICDVINPERVVQNDIPDCLKATQPQQAPHVAAEKKPGRKSKKNGAS
jgi:hypothetical protein